MLPSPHIVLVLFVMACHSAAAPVTSPQPEHACAPALPLLASQHTPNATRIYLAPLTISAGSITPLAWREVGDLAGKIDGTITRLLVSDDQRRLAIVVHVDSPS